MELPIWQLYPAVLFPGNWGHNVGRELWIPRVLSTPRQQTMCRERVYFVISLLLVSVCLRELSLSTFFVSHLFLLRFPTLLFLRAACYLAQRMSVL